MKYTKKDRDEAAWLCAVFASDRAGGRQGGIDEITEEASNERVARLAQAAFVAVPMVPDVGFFEGLPFAYAEAESWIRTGWTP